MLLVVLLFCSQFRIPLLVVLLTSSYLLFWLACFVGLFQLNRYTRYAVLAFACLPRVVYS